MNYYIADTHFGHESIARRRNMTTEEMDRMLIEAWNSAVMDEDDIYLLGDFCYKPHRDPVEYIRQLRGRKHLVIGNHDVKYLKRNQAFADSFVETAMMLGVNDDPYYIVLCHYPIAEWNGYFHKVYHFYGHIHNTTPNNAHDFMKTEERAFNVGVDVIGPVPLTAQQIITNRQLQNY